jgi:two-component system NarL family sensor kinase
MCPVTGGRDASRAALWVARLGAVLAVGLSVTAAALPLLSGLGYLDELVQTPEIAAGIAFSFTGAWLVGSRTARPMGWLLLGIGLCSSSYAASASYVVLVLGADVTAPLPEGAALATGAAWVTGWAWFPSWLLVSTALPQLLPHGRPLPGRWRLLLWPVAGVLVVGVVSFATAPGEVGFFPAIENPLGVPAVARVLDPIGTPLDVLVPVLVLASLLTVVVRLRRADSAERRQVGWVAYAVVVAVALVAFAPALWVNVAVLLVPAGIAVAALRYRLYDLDLLVNRTLVAGVLLGLAALAYVAVVAWIGSLVGTSGGVTPFLAAFAVALAFHPARIRVQRGVDQLFFGRRLDPLALLRDLDTALRQAPSPRVALQDAVRVVRSGLRLPGAALEVRLPSGDVVRAQDGAMTADVTAVPLDLHDDRVGMLLVAPRSAGEPVRGTDLRALHILVGPLASAAYAVRLSGDLEESRRRLLEAREEERRRLRRDLHDGLGPQLAGVVMGLDVVGSALARGDHARATDLARAATEQAREAVEDVRRLAHGLRPPVLDDLGLVAALRSAGPIVAPGGPHVEVCADGDLDDLPAAVEVAAYRITLEAVTNAVRHAGASRIEVRLGTAADDLVLEVCDDGRGVAPDSRPGVGLASMQERAAEVGGWCSVAAQPRGTRVVAHLPRRMS